MLQQICIASIGVAKIIKLLTLGHNNLKHFCWTPPVGQYMSTYELRKLKT